MPSTDQAAREPFIEVDYAAKVVFIPKPGIRTPLDLRTSWQESQGLWRNHPVFRGMSVGDVITWLRGEDCDV
jgi:hypothetical protein